MTTAIAILNAEAVALSADSAVTINWEQQRKRHQKIYQSEDKIYKISDVAPVGIVTYGNSNFMEVPWGTVISEYRNSLGNTTFPTLKEYVNSFLEFLSGDLNDILGPKVQVEHMERLVTRIFEEIDETVEEGEFPDDAIDEYYNRAKEHPLFPGAPDNFNKVIDKALKPHLKEFRNNVFNYGLSNDNIRKLNLVANRALSGWFEDLTINYNGVVSGIAIAGLGDKELFPSLIEIEIEGLMCDSLKTRMLRESCIGGVRGTLSSSIVTMAQTNEALGFIWGLAPYCRKIIEETFAHRLEEHSNTILENIPGISGKKKSTLKHGLSEIQNEEKISFSEEMLENIDATVVQPIKDVVSMMPKAQLAEMAEMLVNLTSFHRRMSLEEETVGGPTDVALITKSDGFVWVKRKNYFPAELNPAYFAREYGGRG